MLSRAVPPWDLAASHRSSSSVVVLHTGEFASSSSSHRCPRIARPSPLSPVVAWSQA
jgi:hypothetical protein